MMVKTAVTAAIVMLPSSHINDFNLQITFYALYFYFLLSFIMILLFRQTRLTILILHIHITEDTSQCLLIVKYLDCALFLTLYIYFSWTILKVMSELVPFYLFDHSRIKFNLNILEINWILINFTLIVSSS